MLPRRFSPEPVRRDSHGPLVISTRSPSGGQDPFGRLQSVLQAAEASGVHVQAPDPETSHLAALAKLGELHSQGVLTDAEFAAEKSRLIGQ